ncbi:MAG: Zn-ribbon domain-containing OB-fold protein [Chloroflexi bacterium]|nr:Zn-ribbon domain-containing OB-fold protein [Chloroflexota bacterium]
MTTIPKPLPAPDASTKFYWESAKRHKLAILRCKQCSTFIHPPRPMCRTCQSSDLAPFEVSGRGKVYTFTKTHYIYHPAFQPKVPYVVALVELDDDPSVRIVSNIVDCPADEVRIGMPVEVTFEDISPEVSLPQFRPVKG